MMDNTVVTPESKTLKEVETVCALLVTVPTIGLSSITPFNGRHIKQTVDWKIGGQSVEVSFTDPSLSSTFRTCNHVMAAACSLNASYSQTK